MANYGRHYDRGAWGGGHYGGHYGDRGGYGAGGPGGWGRERAGYDSGYRSGGFGYDRDVRRGGGYDRSYKSRWQTDFGDPFGDRSARPPIRVMRGEYEPAPRDFGRRRGYDEGRFGMHNRPSRYGRDWW